jgi:hypothetical protein
MDFSSTLHMDISVEVTQENGAVQGYHSVVVGSDLTMTPAIATLSHMRKSTF